MTFQPSLFDSLIASEFQQNHLGISGLGYYPRLLSDIEQLQVLREVDARPWLNDLKRRVQHFGYKYNYKARAIDHSMYVGELPPFGIDVARKLLDLGLLEEMPDQMIVNEYQPGQGITAHVDCEPCFKDTIATVSLGSVCEMEFTCLATGEPKSLLLELGSALILSGEARYQWKHCIKPRLSDSGVKRGRRVSLTFRNVIIHSEVE